MSNQRAVRRLSAQKVTCSNEECGRAIRSEDIRTNYSAVVLCVHNESNSQDTSAVATARSFCSSYCGEKAGFSPRVYSCRDCGQKHTRSRVDYCDNPHCHGEKVGWVPDLVMVSRRDYWIMTSEQPLEKPEKWVNWSNPQYDRNYTVGIACQAGMATEFLFYNRRNGDNPQQAAAPAPVAGHESTVVNEEAIGAEESGHGPGPSSSSVSSAPAEALPPCPYNGPAHDIQFSGQNYFCTKCGWGCV